MLNNNLNMSVYNDFDLAEYPTILRIKSSILDLQNEIEQVDKCI